MEEIGSAMGVILVRVESINQSYWIVQIACTLTGMHICITSRQYALTDMSKFNAQFIMFCILACGTLKLKLLMSCMDGHKKCMEKPVCQRLEGKDDQPTELIQSLPDSVEGARRAGV